MYSPGMPRSEAVDWPPTAGSALPVMQQWSRVAAADRVEIRVVAAQARQVGPKLEFAAEDRLTEDVNVVQHRMDDRQLFCWSWLREAVEVHRRGCRNSCGHPCRSGRFARPPRWCPASRAWSDRSPASNSTAGGGSPGGTSDPSSRSRPSPTPICRSAQTGPCSRCCRGSRDHPGRVRVREGVRDQPGRYRRRGSHKRRPSAAGEIRLRAAAPAWW